jgi:hypothetical protein
MDAEGDAVATWSRFDGINTIIQAAGYDAAGPRLQSLLIPAGGTARQALSFSVDPADVWSAAGSTAWSFGDGATAGGTSAIHTYRSPGTYVVRVTSSDQDGNASAAERSLIIYPRAWASRIMRVKGRRAMLRVHCPSNLGCVGEANLSAGVSFERRGHPRETKKRLLIGRRQYRVAPAVVSTVPIRLSARGKELVSAAGRAGLRARLAGTGLKHRIVLLLSTGAADAHGRR